MSVLEPGKDRTLCDNQSQCRSRGLHIVVPAAGDEIDRLYAADTWRAGELGVSAARGRETVSFAGIGQTWLRQAAKRWAQQRLATGSAFNSVQAAALAFKRFSGFLATCSPPVAHPREIDRTLIERYLSWLAQQPLAERDRDAPYQSRHDLAQHCGTDPISCWPRSSRCRGGRRTGETRSLAAESGDRHKRPPSSAQREPASGRRVMDYDSLHIAARKVLLDALEAAAAYRRSLVVVGAQAVASARKKRHLRWRHSRPTAIS